MPLGKEVGFGPGHIVSDGDPLKTQPPQQPLPTFGPCLLWPNGRPSQQLLSSCFVDSVTRGNAYKLQSSHCQCIVDTRKYFFSQRLGLSVPRTASQQAKNIFVVFVVLSPFKKSRFIKICIISKKDLRVIVFLSMLYCLCLLMLCSMVPMSISSVFLFVFVHTTYTFDLYNKR